MSSSKGCARVKAITVRTSAVIRVRKSPMAKECLTPSSSLAPKRWEMIMEKPLVMPIANPIIKKFSALVAPTAAKASLPRVCPTIMASIKL